MRLQFFSEISILVFVTGSSTPILRNDVAGSNAYFFNRTWNQYRQEFGSPTSQYWIGLDRLHEITQGNCKIRFDLQLLNGLWYFAQYSTFSVGDLSTNYVLQIGGYSGNLSDAMAYHNGQPFSTYDKENDSPHACAHQYFGYSAYSGSCLALGPILQHLQPAMCFIGTLMGTTNIWMLLKSICCVEDS